MFFSVGVLEDSIDLIIARIGDAATLSHDGGDGTSDVRGNRGEFVAEGRDVRLVVEVDRWAVGRIVGRIGRRIGWGVVLVRQAIERSVERAPHGLQSRLGALVQ